MDRHPEIRQRTAESAKWPRWRTVQFQRPLARSMGSAACEAIVSGFLNNLQPERRNAMASENISPSRETITSESSPFDISVMKPPAECFRRD
jgi:hypothetical protein